MKKLNHSIELEITIMPKEFSYKELNFGTK